MLGVFLIMIKHTLWDATIEYKENSPYAVYTAYQVFIHASDEDQKFNADEYIESQLFIALIKSDKLQALNKNRQQRVQRINDVDAMMLTTDFKLKFKDITLTGDDIEIYLLRTDKKRAQIGFYISNVIENKGYRPDQEEKQQALTDMLDTYELLVKKYKTGDYLEYYPIIATITNDWLRRGTLEKFVLMNWKQPGIYKLIGYSIYSSNELQFSMGTKQVHIGTFDYSEQAPINPRTIIEKSDNGNCFTYKTKVDIWDYFYQFVENKEWNNVYGSVEIDLWTFIHDFEYYLLEENLLQESGYFTLANTAFTFEVGNIALEFSKGAYKFSRTKSIPLPEGIGIFKQFRKSGYLFDYAAFGDDNIRLLLKQIGKLNLFKKEPFLQLYINNNLKLDRITIFQHQLGPENMSISNSCRSIAKI